MSTYEYTGINSSVTIDLLAGAALTGPNAVALALDSDGAKLPSAGGDVVGIAILPHLGDAEVFQIDNGHQFS